MKLPLDNFQILGVSPGSSTRNILMILERRLENCNYPGFSQNTIKSRNELLAELSKPLLDTERRRELEFLYQSLESEDEGIRFIVPPHGTEVAALLLLLESGDCDDCFDIASGFLLQKLNESPARDTALDDLYLLMGYATLEYAKVLRSKRHYEYCVRILEKGLDLIKDQIYHEDIEQKIRKELEDIVPFRILDLLSRDMDEPIRDLGIRQLNDFVMRRGGLDGESDLCMRDDEFKAFFRQIRYFLTVQEQIDLYQSWCKTGSDSACFLLGISLVASGFARRKPERLIQAQEIIQKLNSNELTEISSYISLLLGKVDIIKSHQDLTDNKGISDIHLSSEVYLGRLCAGCREWLARDVLEGYRDLEADPDLEAYFSDRDVTTFIEKCDHDSALSQNTGKGFLDPLEISNRFIQRTGNLKRLKSNESNQTKTIKFGGREFKNLDKKKFLKLIRNKWVLFPFSLLLIFAGWLVFANYNQTKQNDYTNGKNQDQKSQKPIKNDNIQRSLKESADKIISNNPKNSFMSYPDDSEINSMLSEWLRIKSQVLSGLLLPNNIYKVATLEAINRLESERKEDRRKQEKQLISVQLISLDVVSRKRDKIEIMATLKYSDKRIDVNNRIIEKTPKHVFKKTYILVNRGAGWLVQ